MKLFTCGFIQLEEQDYQHQDQSLKKKTKFCAKNSRMKTKVSKASEEWLHRCETFCGICQLNANNKLSADEVEATL